MADRLRMIRDDAAAPDSALAAELLGEFLAGGDGSAALARARAGVAHAFMREIRPAVARMVGAGVAPGEIRRRLLGVCELPRFSDDLRPTFRAAVGRVLDDVLGPAGDRGAG